MAIFTFTFNLRMTALLVLLAVLSDDRCFECASLSDLHKERYRVVSTVVINVAPFIRNMHRTNGMGGGPAELPGLPPGRQWG